MTGTAGTKELVSGVSQSEVDRANAELGVGVSPLAARKSGQPRLQRQAAQSRKTFRVSSIRYRCYSFLANFLLAIAWFVASFDDLVAVAIIDLFSLLLFWFFFMVVVAAGFALKTSTF